MSLIIVMLMMMMNDDDDDDDDDGLGHSEPNFWPMLSLGDTFIFKFD